MAYKAINIAEYIVNKCTEDKKTITHLYLQYLLYFVQKDFLKRGTPAFDDDIEARAFGPCVKEVLDRFEGNGIFEISNKFNVKGISEEDRKQIDRVVEETRKLSTWAIATKIFRPGEAWEQTFNVLGNESVIPKSLLERDAKKPLNDVIKDIESRNTAQKDVCIGVKTKNSLERR